MLGPRRLVNKDLGTQMALGRVVDELIILPAPTPFEGTLLIKFGLGELPFGQSLPRCPFSRHV